METSTKNKQSAAVINKMVERAFCGIKAIEVTELKEGYFNVAYALKLSDGRDVILKIAPPKESIIMTHEKNIMFTEVEVMNSLRSKTDIPVAEVLYYDNSHSICGADYFFMSKLSGRSLNSVSEELDVDSKKGISYELGKLNAKINSIRGELFGYYGQPHKQGKDWHTVFSGMIADEIRDAKALSIDIGVEFDVIEKLLSKSKTIFEELQIPRLVHWDLWAGNVFVENGKITGLIDFERCLWADELMEVAFRSNNYNEDFYKGYGIGTLTDTQRSRIKWYDLYLYLIWVLECDYRNYVDRGMYNWAKKLISETVEIIQR